MSHSYYSYFNSSITLVTCRYVNQASGYRNLLGHAAVPCVMEQKFILHYYLTRVCCQLQILCVDVSKHWTCRQLVSVPFDEQLA